MVRQTAQQRLQRCLGGSLNIGRLGQFCVGDNKERVYGRLTGWFFERLLFEEIKLRFLKLPAPQLTING